MKTIIAAVMGLFLAMGTARGAVNADIARLVQQIAPDSLDTTVRRLVAFETRFMGSDSNAAASVWLGDELATLGYAVRYDTFTVNVNRSYFGRTYAFSNLKQWNVIATKPGSLFPQKQVVIGGHYDTIALDRNQDDQDVAPGADDNASGLSAVLEIARLVRDVDLDKTLVFAFWGAEELGLIGSQHYASEARKRGDQIEVMLQLDAIGTRSTIFANGFAIDTTAPHLQKGEVVALAAADYSAVRANNGVGGRVRITERGCRCSDHQSFIDQGFPALGIFQFFDNPAPHLNSSADTLDHVDLSLVLGIAQASLGAVLEFVGFPGRTADFDGDGHVNFSDFVLFARAFNAPFTENRFDLDSDGLVEFSDFLIFAQAFGQK